MFRKLKKNTITIDNIPYSSRAQDFLISLSNRGLKRRERRASTSSGGGGTVAFPQAFAVIQKMAVKELLITNAPYQEIWREVEAAPANVDARRRVVLHAACELDRCLTRGALDVILKTCSEGEKDEGIYEMLHKICHWWCFFVLISMSRLSSTLYRHQLYIVRLEIINHITKSND